MENYSQTHEKEVSLALVAASVIILLSVITQVTTYLKERQHYNLLLTNTEEMTENYKNELESLRFEYALRYYLSVASLAFIVISNFLNLFCLTNFYMGKTLGKESYEHIRNVNYVSLLFIVFSLFLMIAALTLSDLGVTLAIYAVLIFIITLMVPTTIKSVAQKIRAIIRKRSKMQKQYSTPIFIFILNAYLSSLPYQSYHF